jgi:hypothetical protein
MAKKMPSTRTSKNDSAESSSSHVPPALAKLAGSKFSIAPQPALEMLETSSRSPQNRCSYLFRDAISGNQDRLMVTPKFVKQRGFGGKKRGFPAPLFSIA